MMAEKSEGKAKERIRQDYDRTDSVRAMQVGDLVLVLLPSSSNNLFTKWQGLFPITEKIFDTTYRVGMVGYGRLVAIPYTHAQHVEAVCLLSGVKMEDPPKIHTPTWTENSITMVASINVELGDEQ